MQVGAIARGGYGHYSDNIDDLKTAGCYLCVNISGGTVPTGSEWFTMFVIVGGTGSCIQIASGAVSAGLWIRHYDGNAWSTWKRMAATDDLANYLPLSGGTMTGALGVNNNLAILSGYTDSASTLAQLQAAKDNQNSAILQLERPLDNQTQPNVALYQRVNGGDYTRVGNFLHTGNIANYSSKVVAGAYTGNGTSGYVHQSSLTFDFVPKLIFISSGPAAITSGMRNTNAILHPMAGGGMMWYNQDNSGSDHQKELNVSLNGNTVNWYHYSQYPQYQLNYQNIVYNYVAIG